MGEQALIMPTGAEINRVIIDVIIETRETMGDLGKKAVHVYEGVDGIFVNATITAYEAYQAELQLFGQEVANYNYEVRHANGN